jgi:hypothetical protein
MTTTIGGWSSTTVSDTTMSGSAWSN